MSLRNQAAALAFMHAADILQPLIIVPYAARVLQPERFGLFVFVLSIGAIISTIVDYGFHWTGQRHAALARNDDSRLAHTYACIVGAKLVLFVPVVTAGLVAAPLIGVDRSLFLCALTTTAGNVFFPGWLFIGIERPWNAAAPSIVARLLLLVAFLLAVRRPDDVALAIALQGAGPLVAAICSIPLLFRFLEALMQRRPERISFHDIIAQFKDGRSAFLFTLVERIIMTVPVPMVAHFGGYVAAGQFSIADKFLGVCRPVFRLLMETFLPRVAYYAKHAPTAGIGLLRMAAFSLMLGAGMSLALYFIAPFIVLALFGPKFAAAIPIVKLLAVLPLLININMLAANLYMFNFGHERAWSMLIVVSMFVFFSSSGLALFFDIQAATAISLGVISRELCIAVVSTAYFIRYAATHMGDIDSPAGRNVLSSATVQTSSVTVGPSHRS